MAFLSKKKYFVFIVFFIVTILIWQIKYSQKKDKSSVEYTSYATNTVIEEKQKPERTHANVVEFETNSTFQSADSEKIISSTTATSNLIEDSVSADSYESTPDESDEKDSPSDEDFISKNEAEFLSQEGDNIEAWQAIHDYMLKKVVSGVLFSHMECRQLSCRLELQLTNTTGRESFLGNLGSSPFDKGGFFYTSDDGERLIVFANH